MISMSFTLNYMPQLNKFLSKNKTVNVSYDHFAWSCRFVHRLTVAIFFFLCLR